MLMICVKVPLQISQGIFLSMAKSYKCTQFMKVTKGNKTTM